jgi:hypothetical protein
MIETHGMFRHRWENNIMKEVVGRMCEFVGCVPPTDYQSPEQMRD